MLMGLSEFNSIIRRAKQEEDFVNDVKAIMLTHGKEKAEAKEIAIHKWLPVVLALKHGLNINGSGGDTILIDEQKLSKDRDMTRDVMFVYDTIDFDDICPYNGTPSYEGQPVAPSPGAYTLWRFYHFRENGLQEFIDKTLHRFGPSRNELDKRNSMSDDGQSLVELNKTISKARLEAEATVAGYVDNVN